MNERLLQYIWQFRYYQAHQLQTTDGQPLQVQHPGQWNSNQGPDFANARIQIGDTLWAGAVELHLKTSDWQRHGHTGDAHYEPVVLHVVWQHDQTELPNQLPVLELQSRVSSLMLHQYEQWMSSQEAVPCQQQWHTVPAITWQSWKDRLLTERLQQKMQALEQHLQQTKGHWEEVFWRMLCRYMGGHINGESFEQVAVSLPIKVLARHKAQIHQLEALLLGQAGLLHARFEDKYAQMLYKEYQFLQQKYGLRVINKPPSHLRLRPANFPAIRLAQLAMLIHQSSKLFGQLRQATELKQVWPLLQATANDYWADHFKPDQAAEGKAPRSIGRQMQEVLLVNAVVPVLFAYGKLQGEPAQADKALQWLQAMPAETNQPTALFKQAGLLQHAYDSQAVLHLRKQYCDARRCLECAIGNRLLRQGATPSGS